MNKKILFCLALLSVVLLGSAAFAENTVIQVSIDKFHYLVNSSMNVGGAVYNESGAKPDINVTISISGGNATTEYTATADSSGIFNQVIVLTDLGQFYLNASYSDSTSPNIDFDVSNIEDVVGGISAYAYEINLLSTWQSNPGWNTTSVHNGTFTVNGTTYYVLAENTTDNLGVYSCSDAFVDDDTNFNFTDSAEDGSGMQEAKYLVGGSKFVLSNTTYEIVYIDPNCTKTVIVEYSSTIFGGGEQREVIIAPVGQNDTLLNMTDMGGNVTFEIYSEGGTLVSNETVSRMNWNYTVPTVAGRYYVYADGYLIDTFEVKKFNLIAKVVDEDGNEMAAGVSAGRQLNLTVFVLNSSSGAAISTATVVAQANATNSSLTYDSSQGYYYRTITAPSSGSITYKITAAVGSDVQTIFITIDVRSFKLSTTVFSPRKGESEGIAPGSDAVIIVSAYNMSSGAALNLSTATSNCNESLVVLQGIYDKNGDNQVSSFNNVNLSAGLDIANPPEFVRQDMLRRFGASACVINFSAPSTEGMYTTEVAVTVDNTTERSYSSLGVQEIFVNAHPMSNYNAFQWYVTPGSRVYLGIDAFDGATGEQIPAANITSTSLMEVMAGSTVVTEYMLNESFSSSTQVSGGTSTFATLSFVVNDSVMGDHFVRFKIKANVTRSGSLREVEALGAGWFMEKKYHVFAMPLTSSGQWYFGENDTVRFKVMVFDESSMGSFGMARNENASNSSTSNLNNMAVTVEEVKESFTWKSVAVNSTIAQTDNLGEATVNVTPSLGLWDTGSYEAKIKITSADGSITDYGWSWFEVKSFMFWAWTNNWQVSLSQEVAIATNVQDANWMGVDGANVSLERIIYHGNYYEWLDTEVPFTPNANTSAVTSGGQAQIVIPANTILRTGGYEAILNATLADGRTQSTRTWFQAKAFVIAVRDLTKQDMWNPYYAINSNMTLNITAGTSYDWGQWPIPISGSHNIVAAWAETVEKQGIMGPFMRKETGSSTNIIQSYVCSGNSCNLTINTTGLDTGSYNMKIVANDTAGNEEEEWYWFQVKTFDIVPPELKRVRVSTTYKYLNKSAVKTDTSWKSCTDSQVTAPTSLTKDCKAIDSYRFFDDDTNETRNPRFSILIDLNASNKRIFIDTAGAGDENVERDFDFNISKAYNNVSNYTVGQYFNISDIWFKVVSIDTTVFLESNNTVFYDGDANGKPDFNNDNWNTNSQGCDPQSICKLRTSDSSGTYYLKHESWSCWECLADDYWFEIDLDGDGNYWDSYYLAVQINDGGGVKNIYADSDTNFRTGAHTYPGTAPVNFTNSGTPIYYIGYSFLQTYGSSSSGQSVIEVLFTSNRTGWSGMDLGTFKPGTNVSIPVIVTDPDGNRVSGATVNISQATLIDQGQPTEVTLTQSGIGTTDASGVAVVTLNTSWFNNPFSGGASGRWALNMQVTKDSSTGQLAGMPWDWPKIEVRSFRLRVEPGLFGEISGLKKLNADLGTLSKYTTYEAATGRLLFMYTGGCGNSSIATTWDWQYRDLYYDIDSGQVVWDSDSDCDIDGNLNEDTTRGGAGTTMSAYDSPSQVTQYLNITSIAPPHYGNITLNKSGQNRASAYGINFTLNELNLTGQNEANITVYFSEWNWEFDGIYSNEQYLAAGAKVFILDNNTVNITWSDYYRVYLTAPWPIQLGGEWKVIKIANLTGTGYELVTFDNASLMNAQNLEGYLHYGRQWTYADQALLINATTGALVRSVLYGDYIPEIGKTLFGGLIWDNKVYLTNLTNTPFPLPWTCDGTEEFVFGNFTEGQIGVNLRNRKMMGPESTPAVNASQSYNILLFDNQCDGIQSVSGGYYDDERDMMDSSVCPDGGWWCSDDTRLYLDLYGAAGISGGWPNETGTIIEDWSGNKTFNEQWFSLGQEQWPIQFIDYNFTDPNNGTITTQTRKEMFSANDTVAYMIIAQNLDGTQVTGNASVSRVMDMMNFVPTTTPTDTAQIVNGVGILTLANFTNEHTSGGFIINIRVCNQANECESIERSIFIGSMSMTKCMGPDCGPEGGGGGMGGGY